MTVVVKTTAVVGQCLKADRSHDNRLVADALQRNAGSVLQLDVEAMVRE